MEGLKTKIAISRPFEGAPKINMPSIIGASANKPILYRVAVTGQRPIEYSVEDLPKGLVLNGNILSGAVKENGEYRFTLCAKNELGFAKREITLEIKEQNVLVTPLLGYTTWNAFESKITQADVEGIAQKLVELGISEYGYGYVNTDSGWQGTYGGEYDAIMPNYKFPDMKKMTDKIHSYGLKCGIYSTPMLTAWGCPEEFESIPGCTRGTPDKRFSTLNGGIGTERMERNNACQWNAWGFDYLKYDWAPTDTVNAELMREELIKQERDFGFCVTVRAIKEYSNYWSKYTNSYRSNADTLCNWFNLVEIYNSYFDFMEYATRGHYFDLDMLDFGTCRLHTLHNTLTDDEKILEFSIRAFLSSPIQISSTLEHVDDFELSVYCNEEILAINQDCAFDSPQLVFPANHMDGRLHIWEKALEDGTYAYAIFNFSYGEEHKIGVSTKGEIRDLWAKENIGADSLNLISYPHTAKILKTTTKCEFSIK